MNKREFTAARDWRIRNELTVDRLSEAIGYAPEVIYAHERLGRYEPNTGRPRSRKVEPPKPWAWQRYKRACGDLDAELNGREKGKVFAW